jgi:hypothetical protein
MISENELKDENPNNNAIHRMAAPATPLADAG